MRGRPMPRKDPNVLSFRADDFSTAAIRKMAAQRGLSLASYLRNELLSLSTARLAASKPDPLWGQMLEALGLTEASTPEEISDAIKALIAAASAPADGDEALQA